MISWKRTACSRFIGRWSEHFDAGRELSPADEEHLRACLRCAAFVRAAKRSRVELNAVPLPPPDPAADLRLLMVLQERGRAVSPSVGSGQVSPLNRRLGLVAVGSFGFTFILAGVLAVLPMPVPPVGGSIRSSGGEAVNHPDTFLDTRLDTWTLRANGSVGLFWHPITPAVPEEGFPAPERKPRRPIRRGAAPGSDSVG